MGAGASSDTDKRKSVQRTIVVGSPARGSHDGGERVVSPTDRLNGAENEGFMSQMQLDKQNVGKWQIEEEIGRWIDLNSGAADRIEASFQNSKPLATCTLHNRICTADLVTFTIEQGAAKEKKRIRRLVTDKGLSITDPFAIEDVPVIPIITSAQGEVDVDNGKFSVELQSVIHAHNSSVFCSRFALDGQTILSSAKDGVMKHWEVASSFLRQEFEALDGPVLCMSLSSTAPLAANGSDDDKVRLYNLVRRDPTAVLAGHEHKVYGVDFTRDGRTIVSSSMDRTLRTWDVHTLKNTRVVKCHDNSIFSQRVSPLHPWLILTASDDHTMASHDLRLPGDQCITRRFKGHTKTLWGCDIRFDEEQFISCGTDNKVMLWDPRNESSPVLVVESHSNPVHCVEYLPDGGFFLSSGRDMSFKITNATSGVVCLSTQAHDGYVYGVTYNAATDTVMTCGQDAKVKIWSLRRKL